ncbi:MAG TPA: SseB family protein [Actinoplanes sp.]|nr:SseB family protein [Actinoplanes sp.]
MTEWEPAADAEAAMRDALRADDQESYFRILAGLDLLLPVSADALAGLAPLGWGTWSTGGRTHVLAFTSPSALQECLADYSGSARRISFGELADTWPNLEWWLAVNPGLPIEGYLPAWFVAQLARGDLRLPKRRRTEPSAAVTPASAPASTTAGQEPAGEVAAPAVPTGEVASPAVPAGEVASPTVPAGYQLPTVPTSAAPTSAAPASSAPAPVTPAPVTPAPLTTSTEPEHGDPAPITPVPGGPLPRRPLTPAAQRPTSMAAAAQAIAATRAPQVAPPAGTKPPAERDLAPVGPVSPGPVVPVSPGRLAPPVIPGTSSTGDRLPSRTPDGFGAGAVPASAARPATPPTPATGIAPRSAPPAPQSVPPVAPRSVPPVAPQSGASGSSGWEGGSERGFQPANDVERDLLAAADSGSTDVFLSTLLLATVLVPVGAGSRPGAQPGDPGFVFDTQGEGSDRELVVFTSTQRLTEHCREPVRTASVRFHRLIENWPDESLAFAVNPGSPVCAKLPGAQIVALASWATDAGLTADASPVPEPVAVAATAPVPRAPRTRVTMMQKTIPPGQVEYFLDRGYDRVSGFVHRAHEVAQLRTPAELHRALGLGYEDSPHQADAKEAYVLRWAAYRPSLYRIPYGGQTEQAMRAMDGWVQQRAPFRGNGFAPGEGRDVIAEFKVDSARLPHGAQLWRIDADGEQRLVAVLDCDAAIWRRVGEQ